MSRVLQGKGKGRSAQESRSDVGGIVYERVVEGRRAGDGSLSTIPQRGPRVPGTWFRVRVRTTDSLCVWTVSRPRRQTRVS